MTNFDSEQKVFFYDSLPPVIGKFNIHDEQLTLSGIERAIETPAEEPDQTAEVLPEGPIESQR